MDAIVQVRELNAGNGLKPRVPDFLMARLLLARKFVKFCLVGGTGVVVDMGVLFLLADSRILNLNIILSKGCAAEIALINNFIWNELWTFRRASAGPALGLPLLRRFLIFNVICGIGIGLAVLLLHLFHTWLGWNLYLSNLLAILLVTCWNFGLNSKLNWRDGRLTQPVGQHKQKNNEGLKV
jgi:dolichol-phosphate mannosyltransferase